MHVCVIVSVGTWELNHENRKKKVYNHEEFLSSYTLKSEKLYNERHSYDYSIIISVKHTIPVWESSQAFSLQTSHESIHLPSEST